MEIFTSIELFLNRILAYLDPWWHRRIPAVGSTWLATQLGAKSRERALANSKQMYINHYEIIRREARKREADFREDRLGSGCLRCVSS